MDLYERLETAKRLRCKRKAKAAKGSYASGNTPIGYKRKRHSRKLVIDPEVAEVVKHGFGIRKKHQCITLEEITARYMVWVYHIHGKETS